MLGGGAPVYVREQTTPAYLKLIEKFDIGNIKLPADFKAAAQKLWNSPNLASKNWITRQYDSMVRTGTMTTNRPSDAAIVYVKGTKKVLALTTDCNSAYVYADPYKGGMIAVPEAARNIVCAGGEPVAITNCLNFGNPYNPEVYYQFAQAIRGMGDACRKFETPVTGGNVSFYNQYSHNGDTIPVYPTPTIGMLGSLDDYEQVMTYANQDSGFQVTGGSLGGALVRNQDNVLVRNLSYANGDHGFDNRESEGTRLVSNTSFGNQNDGFSIEGNVVNATLANNVAAENGGNELYVDASSAGGFAADYDVLWHAPGSSTAAIRFAGVSYDGIRFAVNWDWMPDGRTILLVGLAEGNEDLNLQDANIYAVDVASGRLRRLTPERGLGAKPVSSPDGKLIAFVGHPYFAETMHTSDLWVMSADGSGIRNLSQGYDRDPSMFGGGALVWAPDGSGLYFSPDDRGTHNIVFAPVTGAGIRPITTGQQLLDLSSIAKTGEMGYPSVLTAKTWGFYDVLFKGNAFRSRRAARRHGPPARATPAMR